MYIRCCEKPSRLSDSAKPRFLVKRVSAQNRTQPLHVVSAIVLTTLIACQYADVFTIDQLGSALRIIVALVVTRQEC
jgi:hypothetical protein